MSAPSESQTPHVTQTVVKPKDLKKALKAVEEAKKMLKDRELLLAVSATPTGIAVSISTVFNMEPVAGCPYTALKTVIEKLEKEGFIPYWIEAEGTTLVIKALAPQE
ncbi:hypothetical protein J7L13_01865 [bacterium]|nr:hypothetical protein [bacterium]